MSAATEAPSMLRSRAARDEADIGDPVALPSRKPRLGALAIKACRRSTNERLSSAFERIDTDYGVEVIIDAARYHRHDAAAGADMEIGCSRAERVLRYERGILNFDFQ